MKFRSAWMLGSVVALVCVVLFAINYIEHIPPQRLASLLGITVTVSDLNTPTPSPSPRVTPGVDQAASLGSVAVQTYSGAAFVSRGAGTAVSSDGLILTTSVAAPWGSGSFVYQVATPRGQLLRARRVAGDQASGLVLLKTDANDLDAVLFDTQTLVAGQQLQAVSAAVLVSTFVSQRLPVSVVYSADERSTALSLDRAYGSAFNGARLVDANGHSVGLVRWLSQPVFVGADTVNAFIESYLSRQPKQ